MKRGSKALQKRRQGVKKLREARRKTSTNTGKEKAERKVHQVCRRTRFLCVEVKKKSIL